MGQGDEIKTREEPQVEIQERGEIFFFYRPKIEREEVHGPDDVQRLYIVLRPESGERPIEKKQDPRSGKEGAKRGLVEDESSQSGKEEGGAGGQDVNIEKESLLRLIIMGKKSLPNPQMKSQPYWGYVDLVTTKIEDIKDALGGEEYGTSTRGLRHKYPCRPLAEGVYRVLRHNPKQRMHTHLVYKLEFPSEKEKDEPQESLNIEHEGSFLIQIRNPDQPGGSRFRGLLSKRKATFPANLQGQFGHRRFVAADPPDFLNYEGCELLLISASDDIEAELGLEIKTECEADPSYSDLLGFFGDSAPTTALFKGRWV